MSPPTQYARLLRLRSRINPPSLVYYSPSAHKGNFLFFWTALVSLCFLYNLTTIPLRFAFDDIYNGSLWWLVGDYFIADLVYLLDLIVVQPHVNFLYDGSKVTKHWLCLTTLWIFIVSSCEVGR